jgi:Mg-chelatase subunit ChlD
MKKSLLFVFALIVSMQIISQEKKITGTVSDSSGIPLPGVNVIVKGTTTGTQSDFDGNYEILAKVGDILTFTYIGFKSVEHTVGGLNIINVTLLEDVACLDEVVVTALGIKREKRALGYAISDNIIEHGQLTAGEINDIENWNDWISSLKHKDFSQMQSKWLFYLKEKIEVFVKDYDNNPIANIDVFFYSQDFKKIFSSKTDALGKTVLFVDKDRFENEKYFTIQLKTDNQIIGKKITKTHKRVEFVLDKRSQTNDADIMFTIDATGSMGDEMEYLKAELQNIFNRVNEKIENKRVALTFYRDHGDEFVVQDFDFSNDIEGVKKVLSSHYARGGGDYEEAVEEALRISMSKSWNENARSRILFLLLDAPPHFNDVNVKIIQNQISIAQKKGIKIIPIVASDANKDVEFLMRFFSVSTNGTYVFLTDDSGIGNDHIQPTNSTYQVEKLNDLIVRLINKYCGV